MSAGNVVLLAGGTGGGKLAAGLQDLLGERLTVVANTADDLEMHGLRVCPDPDLVTYWLAGVIDEERGWGIRDDGFAASAWLERLGAPGWFQLSDRDLATCLYRTAARAEGGSYTEATARIASALGARAAVLPMCEQPVRCRVRTAAGWRELQQFLILDRGEGAVEAVELEGIEAAAATPEVRAAIAGADADRDRAVQSRDLDRADPSRRRDPRGDRRIRRAGGGREPARRRALGEGADGGVRRLDRPGGQRRRGRGPLCGGDRRHGHGRGRPGSRPGRRCGAVLFGLDGGRRGRRRLASEVLEFARGLGAGEPAPR